MIGHLCRPDQSCHLRRRQIRPAWQTQFRPHHLAQGHEPGRVGVKAHPAPDLPQRRILLLRVMIVLDPSEGVALLKPVGEMLRADLRSEVFTDVRNLLQRHFSVRTASLVRCNSHSATFVLPKPHPNPELSL